MRKQQFHQSKMLTLLLTATGFLLTGTAEADLTIVGPTTYNVSVHVTGCAKPCMRATVVLAPFQIPFQAFHLDPPDIGSDFMNTFIADNQEYPGWTAVKGDPLSGTLTINEYLARDDGGCKGGATMDAAYSPDTSNDPSKLTFIQMWSDNYSGPTLGVTEMHIDPTHNEPGEPFTDTNGNGSWDVGEPFSDVGHDGTPNTRDWGEKDGKYNPPDTEPFYYTEEERNAYGLSFRDEPYNTCLASACPFNYWNLFDTYLCSWDATSKQVTVHDGWSWGYDLNCVPVPTSMTLAVLGLGTAVSILRRRKILHKAQT